MLTAALSRRNVAASLVAALLVTSLQTISPTLAEAKTANPVMSNSPVLSESQVRTWFENHHGSNNYRATIPKGELVGHFATEGQRERVDWNIAFAQAILETGWFHFPDTGQVRPEHNNFGGMGAFDGQSGENVFRFPDAQTGVRAKLQHLRIYGDPHVNTHGTNLGSPLANDVDGAYPARWRTVRNGTDPNGRPYHASAQHWEDMGNGRWATDPHYSCKVLNLYRQMLVAHGKSTTGLPTESLCLRQWHLRYQNSGGHADLVGHLGLRGSHFLACDWNGDGRTTPGTFRDGRWSLSPATNGSSPVSFNYGTAGDLPLCGDWNGNGTETVGVVRDGMWHLRNTNNAGSSHISFSYGRVTRGDIPIVGDWNGNGVHTAGIIRDGEWHLRNTNTAGHGQIVFTYGRILRGDRPLVGDWNSNGRDTIGIVRDGEWHLRNSLTSGHSHINFTYGRVTSGDVPLMGDWNRDGRSTPAIVR